MKQILCTALALSVTSTALLADITIRFQESAPKDRFVISTTCPLVDVSVAIDLQGSAGSLIFDVTADGQGVEVFQPVEVQAGNATVQPVTDGDQQLNLTIPTLPVGTDVIISADLDDVLVDSSLGQIRVSRSELDGAAITIGFDGKTATASFVDGSNQVVFAHGCLS